MANITFTSDGGIDTSGPITSEGKNVLTTSDIYNGLDKLASGNALDARQGKVLNDAIEAIINQIGVFNTSDSGPTTSIKKALTTSFNNTGDYTHFIGSTDAAEEGGFIGFRHTTTKGGIVIFFNRNGIQVGLGEGIPMNWEWRRIIYKGYN